MYQLLTGLDAMHQKGIMHRDKKPSNVMINNKGQLKIIDFDLSEYLAPNIVYQFSVSTRGYKPPESQVTPKP